MKKRMLWITRGHLIWTLRWNVRASGIDCPDFLSDKIVRKVMQSKLDKENGLRRLFCCLPPNPQGTDPSSLLQILPENRMKETALERTEQERRWQIVYPNKEGIWISTETYRNRDFYLGTSLPSENPFSVGDKSQYAKQTFRIFRRGDGRLFCSN